MSAAESDLRVMIVADDPLVRAGLRRLLEEDAGVTIVGQVGLESDLDRMIDLYQPQVVIWDLGWDPPQGIERLANLSGGDPPIVALLPDDFYAKDAWVAGAQGLLLREADGERLKVALNTVIQGLVAFDPTLSTILAPGEDQAQPLMVEELTPRELDVVELLAEGLTNKAIAHKLGISEYTVKFHVNAILRKLGAQSRTEAAVRAARLGLITL